MAENIQDGKPPARDELGRLLPGNTANPRGPKKRTEEQMQAEEMLWESTPAAVRRLLELERSDDEKIALGATVHHLKTTLGVLQRKAGPDGETLTPHAALTSDELRAVARAQLEKERAK